MQTHARRWLAVIVALVLVAPPASGLTSAPQRGGDSIKTARDLLDALESADLGISTLEAKIRYERRLFLQGDVQIRWGRLYFKTTGPVGSGSSEHPSPPDARRRRVFAIHFDRLLVGRRRQTDRQDWIFNGEWLIERRPDEKQYVARQIAPPGSGFDPLRLGEGPLPIPIGQRADDVLARYKAKLVELANGLDDETGSVHKFVARTWQLRLTPRATGDEDDNEFTEIRLWYDKATLLPRLARTVSRSGDVSFVQLIDLRVNKPIPAGVFDIEPPKAADGWDVQIKEHRGQ